MTERLYYRDATLRSFTAHITDLAGDGRRVYLDRTAFYPTSGGQPHDLGTLDGVYIDDVVDEGDRIAHVLDAPLAARPGKVTGEIDWPRRFDHMQQHTGQHLLSAVCDDLLQLRTTSVHFGPTTSTLDLEPIDDRRGTGREGPLLRDDQLRAVEAAANDIVAAARPVTVSFEDAGAVDGLRKASDRTGQLRIITIDGIDRSACGGTHVGRTSEIGPVLVRGQERVRSTIRIEFVCGRRALDRARRDFEQLQRIARGQSAAIDEVAAIIEGQVEQMKDLQAENRRLHETVAVHLAESMYRAEEPGPDGVRHIVERRAAGGADASRAVGLAMSALPKAVFIAVAHHPPSVLLATSPDSGMDAGKTLRPVLERVGGRGGGSPRLAQGSVPDAAAADAVVLRLLGCEAEAASSARAGKGSPHA